MTGPVTSSAPPQHHTILCRLPRTNSGRCLPAPTGCSAGADRAAFVYLHVCTFQPYVHTPPSPTHHLPPPPHTHFCRSWRSATRTGRGGRGTERRSLCCLSIAPPPWRRLQPGGTTRSHGVMSSTLHWTWVRREFILVHLRWETSRIIVLHRKCRPSLSSSL